MKKVSLDEMNIEIELFKQAINNAKKDYGIILRALNQFYDSMTLDAKEDIMYKVASLEMSLDNKIGMAIEQCKKTEKVCQKSLKFLKHNNNVEDTRLAEKLIEHEVYKEELDKLITKQKEIYETATNIFTPKTNLTTFMK